VIEDASKILTKDVVTAIRQSSKVVFIFYIYLGVKTKKNVLE
jgi:hypothetical protein